MLLNPKFILHIVFLCLFYLKELNIFLLYRRVITRYARRGGKLWIRIFPDKPVTFRAAETRMGSGKGNVEYWVAVVKPGKILYEVTGVAYSIAKSSLKTAGYKMPVKTRVIYKNPN